MVLAHFEGANGMTDSFAAMNAASLAQSVHREKIMSAFSTQWQHDGLVMDKWFTVQGTNPAEDALALVKTQMNHPTFSMKNPNRIRALIGAFCTHNPVRFHTKDGSGYAFLTDILTELNTSNPQVAARLVDPLLKFRRYDETRQKLMKSQLQRLANLDNLSSDLFEKVTLALSE